MAEFRSSGLSEPFVFPEGSLRRTNERVSRYLRALPKNLVEICSCIATRTPHDRINISLRLDVIGPVGGTPLFYAYHLFHVWDRITWAGTLYLKGNQSCLIKVTKLISFQMSVELLAYRRRVRSVPVQLPFIIFLNFNVGANDFHIVSEFSLISTLDGAGETNSKIGLPTERLIKVSPRYKLHRS